jgi:hypothetical protein
MVVVFMLTLRLEHERQYIWNREFWYGQVIHKDEDAPTVPSNSGTCAP